MKRSIIILGLLAALFVVFTATAQAGSGCCGRGCCGMNGGPRFECCPQGGPGPMGERPMGMRHGLRGRGQGGRGGPLYNTATEKTVDGEVVRVEVMPGKRGPRGVLVWMEGKDDEFIPVHLGPAWFLKDADVKVEKGDRLIVRGSEIPGRGGPAIIAKEFKKQDRLITLRDDEGKPKWSRRQRQGN